YHAQVPAKYNATGYASKRRMLSIPEQRIERVCIHSVDTYPEYSSCTFHTEINGIATSAINIPMVCKRVTRSLRIIVANRTVTAGYNDERIAATSSRPVCVASTKNTLPATSNAPAKNTTGQTDFSGRTFFRRMSTTANKKRSEESLAAASGQNIAPWLTRLIRIKKLPKPSPASNARPNPLGRPFTTPRPEIRPTAMKASTKPMSCIGPGNPSINAPKRTGMAAENIAAIGATTPIRPTDSAW